MSTSNEKTTPNENNSCRQSKKNTRMLRKRHEQLEKENMKIASEVRETSKKNSAKSSTLSEVKEVLTSENEKTETISESSESFDSNDEFRVELQLRDDPEKGEKSRKENKRNVRSWNNDLRSVKDFSMSLF